MKNDSGGIIIILGIIAIALFGGIKSTPNNGFVSSGNATPEQKVQAAQAQVENLKQQLQAEVDKKNQSEYYGQVSLLYANRSTDVSQEYLTIKASGASKTIPITGWTLKSSSSGNSVTIPKATYLFFAGMQNSAGDINLSSGDTLYLVTGSSPNGVSFKVNKCSGYLAQFQTFVPYINNQCPRAQDENLSEIPKRIENDSCFDYIDSINQCRTQTENLPINLSYECKNFITKKLNYSSCVETHKNDTDFYKQEWRVYLRRSERVWKDRRENIVLYDRLGKVVSELKY